MKRVLTLLFFAGVLSFCCNAQNIIQISNDGSRNNNNNGQQQECPFRINGICSTEDIGGVSFEKKNDREGYVSYDYLATNYNSFPVTVLILENYWCNRYSGDQENVLTVVLQPNESKFIGSHANCHDHHIQTITRRLGGK